MTMCLITLALYGLLVLGAKFVPRLVKPRIQYQHTVVYTSLAVSFMDVFLGACVQSRFVSVMWNDLMRLAWVCIHKQVQRGLVRTRRCLFRMLRDDDWLKGRRSAVPLEAGHFLLLRTLSSEGQ